MWTPTPEAWREIEPLVDQLLDLPPEERPRFIDTTFGSNPELKAWAERLAAGSEDGAWMAQPLPELVSDAFEPQAADLTESAELPGAHFGPFKVLRELGKGGMGVVYLAERDDGTFAQRVALKVLRAGIVSDPVRRRFLEEQRMLARLEHPNVARLVDGGVRSDGVPWFAMEYVDGTRLDDWCDRHHASVVDRLRLFLSVCDAVQAAHHRLIVHRDLKPSNILVTEEGSVRLLDFGIAKLLESDGVEGAELTAGESRFTPEYAAPEQWRHERATPATDCYALGVVLYQLLAGTRPHDFHALPRHEWPRLVLDGRAKAPSAVVTEPAASARASTADRLRRQLMGDLDAIVLTAIQPDASRRYPAVRDLADDLRRHLDSQPVTARPDSWSYRASRFLRRNRLAVSLGSVTFAAVIGGAGVAAWQAKQARQAADEARAVNSFLTGMFLEAAPGQSRGDSLTAGEMLERATSSIDTAFRGRPELQVRLLLTVGSINRELAALDRAETLAKRAAALVDSAGLGALDQIATVALLADIASDRSHFDLADSLFRAALTLARAAGAHDTIRARLLVGQGYLRYRQEKPTESVALLQEAAVLGKQLGPQFEASTVTNIATTLIELEREPEADTGLALALSIFRKAGLAGHPNYLMTLGNRASVLGHLGQLDSALLLKEEVLEGLERIYPNGHDQVIIAQNNVASSHLALGHAAAAESGYAQAHAMTLRIHPPSHLLAIVTGASVGRAQLQSGQPARAESTLRAVLANVARGSGEKGHYALLARIDLGQALGAQRRTREALAEFDGVRRLFGRGEAPPERIVALIKESTAEVLMAAGRWKEAEPNARDVLAWRRKNRSPKDPTVVQAVILLARTIGEREPAEPDSSRRAEVQRLMAEVSEWYRTTPSLKDAGLAADSMLAAWQARWSSAGTR